MPIKAIIEPLVRRELTPMLFSGRVIEETALTVPSPSKHRGYYVRMELGTHQVYVFPILYELG